MTDFNPYRDNIRSMEVARGRGADATNFFRREALWEQIVAYRRAEWNQKAMAQAPYREELICVWCSGLWKPRQEHRC